MEDGGGEESGADRRACDAKLQSIAEADEEATEGLAGGEVEEEGEADAGSVDSPEALLRIGM